MKKLQFNILLLFALIIVFSSTCKKDNDLKLEEPSHRVIFTSEMDFENTIEVNGLISFGDASAGVKSRTWTFPDGVVDIIDSDNDKTSNEANVITIFNRSGQYEVTLNQEFEEDAFVGTNLQGTNLDTTIIVTVLDSVEVGIEAYYINPDGSLGDALDISSNSGNEIPAARSVRFFWTGKGSPRFISWDFERADPETFVSMDSIVDVEYKFLGTYDLTIIGSRSRPLGGDTLFLEDFITVIPSTDPVLCEEVSDKDGKIAATFSRELDPATLDPNDFSISVINDDNLITNSFTSVSLDPEDGSIVLFDLGGESIYNDDSITVSFTEGNLFSLDGVMAESCLDKVLEFNKVNLLQTNSNFDYNFETSSSSNWVMAEEWDQDWSNFTLEITSDQVFEGEHAAYVEIEANGNMIVEQRDNSDNFITFPASASKTYEIGVWVYLLEPTNVSGALQPDLRFYWKPEFPNSFSNPEFNSDFPTNQWVYSSLFVTFEATTDYHFEIRGFNDSNTQPLKFYMDNISLSEVELRP